MSSKMKSYFKPLLIAASAFTVAILLLWQATGGDYYTKFEVVEEVEEQVDSSDPLADSGFYDEGTVTKTISREEFRLGLLPVPQRLYDRHAISVTTILLPFWFLAFAFLWFIKHRRSRGRTE
jgi:hypothetical protein